MDADIEQKEQSGMKKIAILSNINLNPLAQGLQKDYQVWMNEGYGNEIEILLNDNSSFYQFEPDEVFLIIDILELMKHEWSIESVESIVQQWFAGLKASLKQNCRYWISNICMRGMEMQILANENFSLSIEAMWERELSALMGEYPNVREFNYRGLIRELGEENAYSMKTWYLGKIIHSRKALKGLQQSIIQILENAQKTPKKLLLLDLDHTLWGGLAGEREHKEIVLSDEGVGLVYKDSQRILRMMKNKGVMLGIVSKNNMDDAMGIIQGHPHMVLKQEDFVAIRINWNHKSENIKEIARELNIGLDSVVFLDDSPLEREEIKTILPDVTVPDFPEVIDSLPQKIYEIYQEYFWKWVTTEEDQNKTEQYHQENARKKWRQQEFATDYAGYLQSLQIKVQQVDTEQNIERLYQLLNKTNQFNLTTYRYEMNDLQEQIQKQKKIYYMYRVGDRFGDVGIVGIVGVEYQDRAYIKDFVMSCRVMGRQIEQYILEQIETDARNRGYQELYASYRQTAKNKPVADFYRKMGYQILEQEEGEETYRITLSECPPREYYICNSQD